MSNYDDYDNSKQAVGDWLAGGGGIFVKIAAGLLIFGFIFFAILSLF